MIFLDSFVDVLDWDDYIIKRVLDIDKKGWVDIVGVKVSVSRSKVIRISVNHPYLKLDDSAFNPWNPSHKSDGLVKRRS